MGAICAALAATGCQGDTRDPAPGEGPAISRQEMRVAADVIRRRIEAAGGTADVDDMIVRPDGRAACGVATVYGDQAGFLYHRWDAPGDEPDLVDVRFYRDGGYDVWMPQLRLHCDELGIDAPQIDRVG